MDTVVPHTLDEIDRRIADLRIQARAAGVDVLPPLLALGTSERVGSNWLSDTLRPVMPQHNEPFRQQLGSLHPLSPVNPYCVEIEQVPRALLGVLGWHGLVEFVVAKYAPVRQLVKETNLFFSARSLLRLFADAPAVVPTRSPLGVASSFLRSDLYRRWGYGDRYRQMVAMTSAGPHARLGALVPDDHPDELTALTRLIVLNTVLLADALDGRAYTHVRYETAVLDRPAAWTALARWVPQNRLPRERQPAPAAGDDLFATTNHKNGLAAYLTAAEATRVASCTAEALAAAAGRVPPSVLDRAATWLTGAEHYQLAERPKPPGGGRARPVDPPMPDIAYVYVRGLAWRNLLVSNAEFCQLLNALHTAGVPNTQRGTHMLLVPMPHERGGRIHWSPEHETWTVSPGFAHHPVYWLTWLGAAVFAAINSARLPTHGELCVLAADTEASNHGYAIGDVAPVAHVVAPHGVHHPVGNVQVWCGDGPTAQFGQPVQRWIHGAAWNTPATVAEVNRLRSRHLLGASRGIGVRLVRDLSASFTGPTVAEVATSLDTWIDSLADRSRSLADLDEQIVRALQADVALRTHVGTGLRPAGARQLNEPLAEPQRRQVRQLDELHRADRPGVRTRLDRPERAAHLAALEGEVNDVRLHHVAHVQQVTDPDLQAGLLAHFALQGFLDRLAGLDLSARQRPRPVAFGVLVQQQDLVGLDHDRGNAHIHGHPKTVTIPADHHPAARP